MSVNMTKLKKDIEDFAKGVNAGERLLNAMCAMEKHSSWQAAGQCVKCGCEVGYRVYAIWHRGSIIEHGHDLDGQSCPNPRCEASLGSHAVRHLEVQQHLG